MFSVSHLIITLNETNRKKAHNVNDLAVALLMKPSAELECMSVIVAVRFPSAVCKKTGGNNCLKFKATNEL